jgi:hypothetical protein
MRKQIGLRTGNEIVWVDRPKLRNMVWVDRPKLYRECYRELTTPANIGFDPPKTLKMQSPLLVKVLNILR